MSQNYAAPQVPTSTFTLNSAASTNATSIKAAAGSVFGLIASNSLGTVAFVKLYNKASAPTVGTDVPIVTLAVPASGNAVIPLGTELQLSLGIALAITNLGTDADATVVGAGQVKVALNYL